MYGGSNGVASTTKSQAQTNETETKIKIELEKWCAKNLSNEDDNISDIIFCNDRSIPGKSISQWTYDTALGYGKNFTAYGPLSRLVTIDNSNNSNIWTPKSTAAPSLKCIQKNDAFTKNDTTKGNGKLKEKVGLITVDEVALAGGVVGSNTHPETTSNNYYYLYKGFKYFTLSPCDNSDFNAYLFYIDAEGAFGSADVHYDKYIVPVINISAEYVKTLKGDGSVTNPFTSES